MKNTFRYYVIQLFVVFMISIPGMSFNQTAGNPYRIEGDEVVFTFDVRKYGAALKEKGADKVDFGDLKVHDVAITGSFNDWSSDGWRMIRKSDFIFELRKLLDDFNDTFPFEFKYIINGKYVADPQNPDANSRQFSNDFIEDVYREDLSTIKVSADGNVFFRLNGFQNASQVILTGSFNGWDERAIRMLKDTDGWHLRATLPPGRYEYKFIIDGEWRHDPENKAYTINEHGTLNSILDVTVPHTFTLAGFPDAKRVVVTGSFVDWHESKLKMAYINGKWRITIPLIGGKHHYKFIIDGQWHTDPSNPILEDDGYGNLNSVLFVH